MKDFAAHITDTDLLLYAEDELAYPETIRVRDHLTICKTCHDTQCALRNSLDGLRAEHRARFEDVLPPHIEARRRLSAALRREWQQNRLGVFHLGETWAGRLSYAFATVLFVVGAVFLISQGVGQKAKSPDTPLPAVTPGDVLLVTTSEICTHRSAPNPAAIPASLRAMVLREYGMSRNSPRDYELDYLITPQLGGATSVRNLWPEPYSAKWNAHVKDQLEDRLHDMVCDGQIDLATAQQAIATNWVAAYQRYFHTSQPLTEH